MPITAASRVFPSQIKRCQMVAPTYLNQSSCTSSDLKKEIVISLDLGLAIEKQSGFARIFSEPLPHIFISVYLEDFFRQVRWITRVSQQTAVESFRDNSDLRIFLDRGNEWSSRRQNSVQFAGYDIAGQTSLERNHKDISTSKRFSQMFLCLVWEKGYVFESGKSDLFLDVPFFYAITDEHHKYFRIAFQVGGGVHEDVEA